MNRRTETRHAASADGAPSSAVLKPLASGIDLAGGDPQVRPQDDLYRFVNGRWLRTTDIPPDRSNYGAFTRLDDQAQEDVHALIEEAARTPHPPGSDERKLGDFYRSFMDTARIDARGLTPLAAQRARIAGLRDAREVIAWFGRSQALGVPHPLMLVIAQDERNATSYIPIVSQSGLTMPDRDYYLDPKHAALRAQCLEYVEKIFALAGHEDPAASAGRVLAIEERLAGAHWTRVRNRDAIATYNKYTVEAATAATPGFDWANFLSAAGVVTPELVISQPSYFAALGAAVREIPLAHWKRYLEFRLIDAYAPFLAAPFVDAHFAFHGRVLKGIERNRPRWKRAVEAVNATLGEIAGRLYVERHFRPEAKRRMDELVANLMKAFERSIDELDWMSPATKAQARAKLARFTVKIGYPERWKDYSALEVSPEDLVGNLMRAAAFEHRRQVDKLGKPIDRTEWLMTPQTVNAYYYPPMNEIVFPAAILQPPFFNVDADDAVNYGAIGAVIGHEISHGFDDQGRKYDGLGNLNDWWTREDEERFRARAAGLVAQYSGFNPIDDLRVNGELTLGENIGDLSGLAVAYRAWELSLEGRPAPVIDGLTGAQRFFMGWSQVWRRKHRDEDLRLRLLTDVHSPAEYRANGIVANMTEFYRAFDVREGDALYRPPEERVRIW